MTYIFARYESTLSDCIIEYLTAFPEKIEVSKLSIKDDMDILSKQSLSSDFKRSLAESYISVQLYKKLEEFLKIIEKQLSINIKSKEVSELLKEKKATRNLIVHNNLRVNRAYLNTAGKDARAKEVGVDLEVGSEYIEETILIMNDNLMLLKEQVFSKYYKYTTLNFLKNLWNYFFDSPILLFDEYWVNDGKDVNGFNSAYAHKWVQNLSSYEKTLLAAWIQQFSSSICQELFDYKDLQFWGPISEELSYITEIVD